MNTIDYINQNNVMSAIITKVSNAGFVVTEARDNRVAVKANCLPVNIAWEMCGCHGGRMWFTQDNTNIHIELSSDEYDIENGINSPETELAYYIDNKMIDTIKSFEKYVYIVDVIGQYQEGKVEKHYFKDVESASYFIFGEKGHDANSEFGEVIRQYPNPDIQERVKYIGTTSKGAVRFESSRINKGKEERVYEYQFHIFRK